MLLHDFYVQNIAERMVCRCAGISTRRYGDNREKSPGAESTPGGSDKKQEYSRIWKKRCERVGRKLRT